MPDDFELTLDELHLDAASTPEAPETRPEDDPINELPEEPKASSPEELELVAQKTTDLDEEPDEKDDKKQDDNASPDDVETPEEEPDTEEDVDMSGIEQYLAQFDIEAGMINFDDGTSTHFNELDAEKQKEVLTQLHGTNASSVEAKYGLDENEIGLINYLRTNSMSVEDMVESMVSERLNTVMALQDIETYDYDQIDADAVYLQFLRRSNPEATVEQLEDDLSKAKEQSNYGKVADSLRNQFKQEQDMVIKSRLAEEKQEQAHSIEEQREEVVEAVLGINDIAGVKINDSIKNGILDRVLEVNEHGDSKFMEEVFGQGDSLFNAAFWYYYGPSLLEQRDNYWKQQKSAAYKRGREEALGKDSTKISFTSAKKTVQQGDSNAPLEEDDWLNLHT